MKTINQAIMGSALVLALTTTAFAQTNLRFTAATPTDEQAIRLAWASTNGELYQIQYANALATNSDGSTAWQTLYDNYPSQGTNTFWLDTGNYNLAPQVLHPKYMPMRFYRIVDLGPDSLASDEPTVSILSPANGTAATGALAITVVTASDQPVISGTKLYVDGQEMQMADGTTTSVNGSTNYETDTYSINTCEWGNGTHILFATAECESGFGDAVNSGPVMTGHGVSPLVPVLFSNLVTRISFSQPSFDPSSGQTQQVSAVFAANSDWTLNIVDVYSNVVRTAAGSGTSILFNWDGNGNGGANLPAGIYFYYITAQTNGQAYQSASSGGNIDGGNGSPPSPSFARLSNASSASNSSTELWAVPADISEGPVPLALYPPEFDTNGLIIFEASPAEIQALRSSVSRAKSIVALDSGFSSDDAPAPASQNVPVTPLRPPNNPVRGLAGSFGVGYDTYTGNGTNGITFQPLDNGLHIHSYISMDNNPGSVSLVQKPLPQFKAEANNFISQMQHWGWKTSLLKVDDQLNVNDLRGSGSLFNNVNLAVFLSHGAYGTGGNGIDYAANGCKQMYFPVTSGGQYLRLSEMNLGGSGTNGLKWMALLSCTSLQHNNWANMQSLGVKPYNSNLHLLLGVDTINYTSSSILWYWSKYMNYGTSTNAGSASALTIRAAWYQAAQQAYADESSSLPSGTVIKFVVAGDSACLNDTLQSTNAPGGSWTIDPPVTVFSN